MVEMNMRGLVRTITDGLKDASMQYEWAMTYLVIWNLQQVAYPSNQVYVCPY